MGGRSGSSTEPSARLEQQVPTKCEQQAGQPLSDWPYQRALYKISRSPAASSTSQPPIVLCGASQKAGSNCRPLRLLLIIFLFVVIVAHYRRRPGSKAPTRSDRHGAFVARHWRRRRRLLVDCMPPSESSAPFSVSPHRPANWSTSLAAEAAPAASSLAQKPLRIRPALCAALFAGPRTPICISPRRRWQSARPATIVVPPPASPGRPRTSGRTEPD